MIIKDEAIVLRSINYSNSSQIITLYTKQHGKISAIAKGVRNSKSKQFSGVFEPTIHIETVYREKNTGVLCLIYEFDVKDYFYGIRKNLQVLMNAFYLIDIVNETCSPEDPSPGLFQLLQTSLKYLSLLGDAEKIRFFFQTKLLILIGLIPQFECCSCCAGEFRDYYVYFHIDESDALCHKCKIDKRGSLMPISLPVVKILHNLTIISWSGLKNIHLSPKIITELNSFFQMYFRNLLNKEMRTSKYIMSKI